MNPEEFISKHFPGLEKETWYPAIVAIAEGYEKQQNEELKEKLQIAKDSKLHWFNQTHELLDKIVELNKEVKNQMNLRVSCIKELNELKQSADEMAKCLHESISLVDYIVDQKLYEMNDSELEAYDSIKQALSNYQSLNK